MQTVPLLMGDVHCVEYTVEAVLAGRVQGNTVGLHVPAGVDRTVLTHVLVNDADGAYPTAQAGVQFFPFRMLKLQFEEKTVVAVSEGRTQVGAAATH